MDTGDTAQATSEPNIAEQVQSAFAALRAETDTAAPEAAEASPSPTEEAPESTDVAETETEPEVKEKVRFKIGDEEVDEDTLLEWKKSGLRQADYTKKRMEDSAKVTKIEQERITERAETLAKWKALEDAVASVSPKEPDWVALQAQVRAGAFPQDDYNRLAADWLVQSQQRQAIATERQKAEEAVQRDRAVESETTAKKNYERVLELLPEWKDVATRQKDFQEIVAYASEMGVDEKVLMGLPPEGFKMARDAAAYRKLQQGGKPKVVKVDGTLKPGSTVTSAPKSSDIDTAARRVAQTHSDADGVAAFRALRKAGLYES